MSSIAQKLKELRVMASLTQEELGILINYDNSSISKAEKGDISQKMLFKLMMFYKKHFKWNDQQYDTKFVELNRLLSSKSLDDDDDIPLRDEIEGMYYIYSPSTKCSESICEIVIKIMIADNKLQVKGMDSDFEYMGTLILNDHNIYIEMEGTYHKERLLMIFYNTVRQNINRLWGVMSSVSVIYEPFCAACLLSRTKISDMDALRRQFDELVYQNNHFIKIPITIDLYRENQA